MKLKNPFALVHKLRQYKALCKRQCQQLTAYNDQITELMTENNQQQKQIRFLQSELKIANEQLNLATISVNLFQQK